MQAVALYIALGPGLQYDLAQMTRRALASPLKMHWPCSEESSSGMARIVTLRSFLIWSSISREPFQRARAKPPWISGFAGFFGVKKSQKSFFELITRVFASRNFFAR